jgi:hypothetical protein
MPSLGKMARVWENRATHNISLTDVVRRLVMKFSAMITDPRPTWVNRIPVLLGEPGIGKSTVLRKMADLLARRTGKKWRPHLCHVGSRGMEDNTGLPVIEEQQGRKIAGWASPKQIPGAVHWLNDDGSPAGFTLGIFDELPSAKPSVQDQIRELIDGTIPGSGDPVDPQCVYIGAGNPPEAKHVTANIIDDAIEKRFKIYAVVPTAEELLQVWSDPAIMPDLLYRFLMVNTAAIEHLSPREWVGVGKDADYIQRAGGTRQEAISEIADELTEFPDVITALQVFFQHGDDPYYYPIRGAQLLQADSAQLKEHLSIMKRWINDADKAALLGATSNDFQRTLKLTPDVDLKGNRRAINNTYELMELLAGGNRPDMVKALIEVVFSTPMATTIGSRMRKESKYLSEMDAAISRAGKLAEKIGAAVSS